MIFRSAPQPTIRLHLERDPVNHPLARSRRERANPLALRDFAESRIGCSWRLGLVRFRQASPPDGGGAHRRNPWRVHHA